MIPLIIKKEIFDYIAYFKGVGGCTIGEIFCYINAYYPGVVRKSQIRSFLDYHSSLQNSQLKKCKINLNRTIIQFYF